MNILQLFSVLRKIRVLTPKGVFHLTASFRHNGFNVMALLDFAASVYPQHAALVDDRESLTYQQLSMESQQLALIFHEKYQVEKGSKIGFLCRNHTSLVKAIFAASRLGASLYMLNTGMSRSQVQQALEQHRFDLLIYDEEFEPVLDGAGGRKLLSYHNSRQAINRLQVVQNRTLKKVSGSKIMLLTGGTTGKPKEVEHKQSISRYLSPFLGLLNRLKLLEYHTAYIATPIYHGYGVAILFSFMALGKRVVISDVFDAENACTLIRKHKVDVITAVPLMVKKMLNVEGADLSSLSCIASGGAMLHASLVKEVSSKVGDVLYNLYGTTETGLNIIATPQDLKDAPQTLGRIIDGVQLGIVNPNKDAVVAGAIGEISLKTKNGWIGTGDLAYQDRDGLVFLNGRKDDMIVSGGENVYPIEVEQILITHPQVEEAAVLGIHDEDFGQRLKAFVVPVVSADLTEENLTQWLKTKVARHQVPKGITFMDSMPYTAVGKMDKKRLREKYKIDYA
ncbi:AMP-binding protein [Bacillus tianshenii]|uniref:AMP-binding protein n=1 Tax=Sutcliffiella tianshenii TaxID=1463404 RepID=UPI001CD1C50F|nr:AMP-binding protein [Bacillus tianshenii]MCA1318653.1 AMP-binding protein [Bacillus tianshenii]